MPKPRAAIGPPARGLTLLELSIALVVLALMLTMSVPSMSAWLARHRLRAAAQDLASDLGEARHEAARLARPVHVVFRAGSDWCYAVALSAQADCHAPSQAPGRQRAGQADAQLLKLVRASDHPGVMLVEAAPQSFDGRSGTSLGAPGFVQMASARGERIHLRMSALGRPSLCTPDAGLPGIARC